MNNQMEQLIANLCDADKRTTDELTRKVAEVVLIHNINDWYQDNMSET